MPHTSPMNQSTDAPDRVALLIIDVINDLDFPEAEYLIQQSDAMAERLLALKQRAQQADIPAIYVNDNFGRWQSDFAAIIEYCSRPDAPGRSMVKRLKPGPHDYIVIKPKHSGFYETTLATLLAYLQVNTLIITGIAGNICVLFTANDAYMREYKILVPADCVLSNSYEMNSAALEQMQTVLRADTRPSTELDLSDLGKNAQDQAGSNSRR